MFGAKTVVKVKVSLTIEWLLNFVCCRFIIYFSLNAESFCVLLNNMNVSLLPVIIENAEQWTFFELIVYNPETGWGHLQFLNSQIK